MSTFLLVSRRLQQEYEGIRNSASGGIQGAVSTPLLPMTNGSLNRRTVAVSSSGDASGRSFTSLPRKVQPPVEEDARGVKEGSDEELLAEEARGLRLHKERLEERSRVLEDHNSQLEVQLIRLKQLIDEVHRKKTHPDTCLKSFLSFRTKCTLPQI